MISKLRELDSRTLTAIGPKFDLEKVLETGQRVLKTLFGRASMRFPDQLPATLETEPGMSAEFDDVALELLAETFRQIHRDAYDAADLSVCLSFGPYLATWSPLGMSALYGPIGNCVTIFEEPWEDLLTTPMIMLHRRDAPFTAMGRAATKFLVETLRSEPYGTAVDFLPDDIDAEAVVITFPHATFGAGEGRIRICRYLAEDLQIGFDDDEEDA